VASSFESKLRAGNFVITAEVSPPLSSDTRDLLDSVETLGQVADAINLTDGPRARVNMCAMAAAALLVVHGLEPIMQLTCRDRNRIALQSDLIGAAAVGIRNLLILTGDPPQAGDQPQAKPVFDLDSRHLIATAVAIRDRSEVLSGRKVAGHAGFFIGVADTPLDPPAEWTAVSLQSKIAAGAQFVQTQFWMDVGVARRYVKTISRGRNYRARLPPYRDCTVSLGPIGIVDPPALAWLDHSRQAHRETGKSQRSAE
jgi:methylenetetrahydrofolate reductase (NADPH)